MDTTTRRILSSVLVVGAVLVAVPLASFPAMAAIQPDLAKEQPFIDENNTAMAKMIAGMTIKPTGDVDRDFVDMMVPHHQGAIDMAQAELRYGGNQLLLRISQEIVVEQLQEIAAMRIAIGEKVSPYEAALAGSLEGEAGPASSSPSPSNAGTPSVAAECPFLNENDTAMIRMMDDMMVKPTGDIDRDFVAMMVPHHQGAIDMAKAELRYGHNPQLRRVAQEIIVDEMEQIALMRLAVGEALPSSIASPTDPSPAPLSEAGKGSGQAPPMQMPMPPHQTTLK